MSAKPRKSPAGSSPRAPGGARVVRPRSLRAWRAPRLPAGFFDWHEPFLLPLILLVITRAAFSILLPLATEDAYITYRYAWNLQAGNGLVYNPGERVMGFTSPVWALWNALGIRLMHDPVVWSRGWALLADATTLIVLVALLRRYAGTASAWCFAVFFAGWNYFAALTASGMEMSALLALMAVGVALVTRNSVAAGPVLGVLALTRPEGLLAAIVLAAAGTWRTRMVAASVVVVGAVALTVYYGSSVLHALVAKGHIYGTPGPWAGRIWWEWVSPVPLGSWGNTSEGGIVSRLAVVLGPSVVAGAAWLWKQRTNAVAWFVVAAVTVWLGYALLGVAYFFWYLAVPLVAAGVLAAVGMPRIVRGPWLYAGAGLFVVGAWLVVPPLYIARAQGEANGFYQVARRLAEMARPGQKILLEPIGIIGYTCPLVVIDEVGLVTPSVTARRLQGPGWLADIATREKPDWLVMRRSEMTDTLAFAGVGRPFRNVEERTAVLANFRVAAWENEDAGDLAIALLRRQSPPP